MMGMMGPIMYSTKLGQDMRAVGQDMNVLTRKTERGR